MKDLKYSSGSSLLTNQHMVDWLIKNKILDIVFNPKTYHVQIVQRSDAIIRFLIEQNSFTNQDLQMVWESQAFDDEVKKEVYKIISECAPVMDENHINFLL